jgi:hypothetical protein
MSNEVRDELLKKAEEMGLEFPKNIPTDKLQEKINQAETPTINEVKTANKVPSDARSKRIRSLKETRIVTITNREARESEVLSTVKLSVHNMYGSISKEVPLDIPVELETVLIEHCKSIMFTSVKPEIIDGKPTGNSIAVRRRKFSVSYEDVD